MSKPVGRVVRELRVHGFATNDYQSMNYYMTVIRRPVSSSADGRPDSRVPVATERDIEGLMLQLGAEPFDVDEFLGCAKDTSNNPSRNWRVTKPDGSFTWFCCTFLPWLYIGEIDGEQKFLQIEVKP